MCVKSEQKRIQKMRTNLGCNFGLDLYMVGKMVVFTKDASSFLGAFKLVLIRVYASLDYPFYNVSYHPLVDIIQNLLTLSCLVNALYMIASVSYKRGRSYRMYLEGDSPH